MPEHDPLRGPAAQENRHLVFQLLAGHQETILRRTLDRITESAHAAWYDRYLVHGVDAGQRQRDQRVPHLVIGDDLALAWIERKRCSQATALSSWSTM
jgi:hypothetical protein